MLLKTKQYRITLYALTAALLFGLSTPISKMLLEKIHPVVLSSLFYFGSGFGLSIYRFIYKVVFKAQSKEARIAAYDIKWLLSGIIVGCIAAPVILMFSLKSTPASTSSLLLNFESISTSIIAYWFFKESIGKRIWSAVIIISVAASLLVFGQNSGWGISLGAAGVVTACILWGLDNNITRNISAKDPVTIVMIKGLVSGTAVGLTAYFTGISFPDLKYILLSMITGFFCYGLSIILFILSMRSMGASRTGAFFSTAPFFGVIFSFIILHETPDLFFLVSLPIMITGVLLLVTERHFHEHEHEEIVHEHLHSHDDGHHNHLHDEPGFNPSLVHSHIHKHDKIVHTHKHSPDLHHRHTH